MTLLQRVIIQSFYELLPLH